MNPTHGTSPFLYFVSLHFSIQHIFCPFRSFCSFRPSFFSLPHSFKLSFDLSEVSLSTSPDSFSTPIFLSALATCLYASTSIEDPSVPIHHALHFILLAEINHKISLYITAGCRLHTDNLSPLPSLPACYSSYKLSSLLNKIDTVCKFRYREFLHRPLLCTDRPL